MVRLDGDQPLSSKADGAAVALDERCKYTRVCKYHCSTETNGNSKQAVRRCEKTEQMFRQCGDRPAEVVDSKTEYTEGDVPSETSDVSRMDRNLEHQLWPPLRPDDLRDVMARSVLDSFEDVWDAAEEAAKEFAGHAAAFSENMRAWSRRPSEEFRRHRFGEDGMPASGRGARNNESPNFDVFTADTKEL